MVWGGGHVGPTAPHGDVMHRVCVTKFKVVCSNQYSDIYIPLVLPFTLNRKCVFSND